MSVMLIEAGLRVILDLPTGPTARYVTDLAEDVAEVARQNVRANFRTRTGNLERSIGLFPEETTNGLAFEVGTEGAPYGLILELGGEPHEILAPSGRVLASAPGHPDPLLEPRLRVQHPSNPPKPWLKPALETVFRGG